MRAEFIVRGVRGEAKSAVRATLHALQVRREVPVISGMRQRVRIERWGWTFAGGRRAWRAEEGGTDDLERPRRAAQSGDGVEVGWWGCYAAEDHRRVWDGGTVGGWNTSVARRACS